MAQSPEIRFSWLYKAAELGDVDAIAEVGESFLWGDGVTQDVDSAILYAQKAANLNNVHGLEVLGIIYGNDVLPENDYNKAIEYNTKAVQLGSIRGSIHLAQNYRVTAKYDEALSVVIKTIQTLESKFPEDVKTLASAYKTLANTNVEIANYSEAEKSI